ncbi:MAG TPA: DUF4375 domain-containing protein [Gemmata sp.]|jgi:hypothetical protein|nr:DUF4375 domain-containing protein [Gemmata sp.]
MSKNVENVLKTEDDSKLCSELFELILKHYNEDFDLSGCKEEDQVIILIWHASGIIDNGGFQYLFEGDFKGDPGFAKTLAAYKAIKATKCAEAIEEALALFPGSKLPPNIEKRLKVYQTVSAAKRRVIDWKFFDESKDIATILAKYIRDNHDEFKHLK